MLYKFQRSRGLVLPVLAFLEPKITVRINLYVRDHIEASQLTPTTNHMSKAISDNHLHLSHKMTNMIT